ncbi:MAG: SpoIIE family protein phosphatase [Candidatus Brocadiia bacterium]
MAATRGGPSARVRAVFPCAEAWDFMEQVRLVDLVDPALLQKLQDSFAAAMRLRVLIRDAAGQAVTRASEPTKIAELLDCAALRRQAGAPMSPEEAAAWEPAPGRPFGIARFVEPVGIDTLCLGSIEAVVLLVGEPLPQGCLEAVGDEAAATPDQLLPLLAERATWGPAQLEAVGALLRSVAGLLSDMCQRHYEATRRVRELSTLCDVSMLMTRTMDLQGRLELLTKITTETLGVKACLIRLLDEENGELTITAVHNLSRRYLEKGPVNLADSVIDQEAVLGRLVYTPDVTRDPRTLYPREAAEEGLVASLCTALRSKGRVIGTIRVYTGQPYEFSDEERRLFQAIANQAATAIDNAALYDEALRAQELDRELAAAAQIQGHLIPSAPPTVPNFELASRYIPFAPVGGDLFDFVPIQDQHLGIVIADVAGKGVPGAILMAATRAILRGHIETVFQARDIIAKTNRSLCRDIGEEQFVTLFYGALHTASRRLTYCNAGHAAPILFRDGQHCHLAEGGLVLGVEPEAAYEERQLTLQPGDVLLFYTDGLTETLDPDHQAFGVERLRQAAMGSLEGSAEGILDAVWHAVRDFARGAAPRDDFTIIVLKAL